MADNGNSSSIVAIVAIVVIIGLGFLAFRAFGGMDAAPAGDGASINLEVPGTGDGQ